MLLAGLLVASLVSCGRDEIPTPVVLVIQDAAAPDAREVITPGVLGLDLGLAGSGLATRVVDVQDLDLQAETSDAWIVAVVIAPFTAVSAEQVAALRSSGLAVVSLSELVEPGSRDPAPFRGLVPRLDAQASAMLTVAPLGRVCSAGDGTAWSDALTEAIGPTERLTGGGVALATEAAERGCRSVIWTGSAPGAVDLARLLPRAAPDALLLLDDRARTPGFAETAEPGIGAQGLCPCVDLTTTAEPAAQRFVHAYQAATGLDPGPFAAEGFDAGRLLASAAVGGSGRDQIAAALAAMRDAEGLSGPYVWGVMGDLVDPTVRMYERAGFRWLERSSVRVAREATRA